MIYLFLGILTIAFAMWQTSLPRKSEHAAAMEALKEPYGVIGVAGAIELVLGFGWIVEGVVLWILTLPKKGLKGLAWLFSANSTEWLCACLGYGFSVENDRLPVWTVPVAKEEEPKKTIYEMDETGKRFGFTDKPFDSNAIEL